MMATEMSTQLYLKDRLENAWNSSAHLRKLSLPMAFVIAILMYPQFVQELYHYHTLELGAIMNATKVFLYWMSIALGIQSIHSAMSHKEDVWNHPVFMALGLIGASLFGVINLHVQTMLELAIAILLYEVGFHARQHIREHLDKSNNTGSVEMRARYFTAHAFIISGTTIALILAAHIGHLL